MASASGPPLRRNVALFGLAFAAATVAFGAVMLTSPPVSEAAVSTLTEAGAVQPVTNCEFLPTGDLDRCTVYR